ncbi:MAG TPA: mechanosensitive ion channel family protein [Ktedonobacterales bacterium]|jgi:small conductance mechanosensitive channel
MDPDVSRIFSDLIDAIKGFDPLSAGAHVVSALLVLLIGVLLALALRALTRTLLGRTNIARTLGPSMPLLLSSVIYYLALGLVAAASLIALGVSIAVVWGLVVVIAIAFLITFRESFGNFAATMIFLVFQPFRRGDLIQTMEHMGTVHELFLFNTVLLLPEDRLVSLPNSKVQESGVVNYSRLGHVRADFTLTVDYSEDISRVRQVIAEVAAQDERILAEPAFEVVVSDLDDTGVRLLVLPTVTPAHYWAVRNDLRERIKTRFDADGSRFAVPQRVVRMTTPQDMADHNGMRSAPMHPGVEPRGKGD